MSEPSVYLASQSHRPPPAEFQSCFRRLMEENPRWRLQWELFDTAMDEVEVFSFGRLDDNKLVSESHRGADFYLADHLRMPFRSVMYCYDVTLDAARMKLRPNAEANGPPPTHRYVTVAIDTDAWGLTRKRERGVLACDWMDVTNDPELAPPGPHPSDIRSIYYLAGAGFFRMLEGTNRWGGHVLCPDLPNEHAAHFLGGLGDGVIGLSMIVATRGIPQRIELPSAKLNAKRARSGKAPLTRITHVDTALYYQALENTVRGGTHASPVPHLRRGHIRRLQDGKTTWIRDCLVNCRSSAEALKRDHYEVEKST